MNKEVHVSEDVDVPSVYSQGDRVTSNMQMAGDVIPLPGDKTLGMGSTTDATPYYQGTKKDRKIIPFGPKGK